MTDIIRIRHFVVDDKSFSRVMVSRDLRLELVALGHALQTSPLSPSDARKLAEQILAYADAAEQKQRSGELGDMPPAGAA